MIKIYLEERFIRLLVTTKSNNQNNNNQLLEVTCFKSCVNP